MSGTEHFGFGPVGWLDLPSLRADYAAGRRSPSGVMTALHDVIAARGDDAVWITLVGREAVLARAAELEAQPARGPLWGVPFSVKDCIDVAGLPTTSACPGFAHLAERTNASIQKLLDAGAILVGKVNMDQFATGLVGVRSPYGTPRNPFGAAYVPGGSSSGSGVSVAAGLVSFSIGTDTGGSGRVPAHYTNTVGLKASRGLLSLEDYVPACRSVDSLTVFALTAEDALEVLEAGLHHNPDHAFSRAMPAATPLPHRPLRCGIPQPGQLRFFGAPELADLFEASIATARALGWVVQEVDLAPYFAAGDLLFAGSWLAERYGAVRALLEASPEALDPIVRGIVHPAGALPAWRAFDDMAALTLLQRRMAQIFATVDLVMVPTAGTCWQIAEVLADPVATNNANGYYTYGANLLDLSGCAVPAGFQRNGMPAGVTLLAPAFGDRLVAHAGSALHRARHLPLGAADAAAMAQHQP